MYLLRVLMFGVTGGGVHGEIRGVRRVVSLRYGCPLMVSLVEYSRVCFVPSPRRYVVSSWHQQERSLHIFIRTVELPRKTLL